MVVKLLYFLEFTSAHGLRGTLLELLMWTTSDPHQWRTTQVDAPPTHGISIQQQRWVRSAVCQRPINQAKQPLTYTGRRQATPQTDEERGEAQNHSRTRPAAPLTKHSSLQKD